MTEKSKYTILIAEDDKDIVEILKLYLEKAEFDVVTAYDGMEALAKLRYHEIDLCIFDVMMPRLDGFSLVQEVRKEKNLPIIILSAKSQDDDKIHGLDIGADDYLTKPFNPEEVVARVRAALRRFYKLNDMNAQEDQPVILKIGELELNLEEMKCLKNGEEISLTPMEYKILKLLMNKPGRVFTRMQMYESICGEYFESDENTMMVHISKLRDRIEDDPKKPKYLKTVRGLGYKFERV